MNDQNNPPQPEQQPLPPPQNEEILKKVQKSDFELGAQTRHLRLPSGLPKKR